MLEWSVRELEWSGVLRRVRVPLPTGRGWSRKRGEPPPADGGELRKLLFDKDDLDRLVELWKDHARP